MHSNNSTLTFFSHFYVRAAIFFISFLSISTSCVYAAADDTKTASKNPSWMKIESDTAILNYKTRHNIYLGHVFVQTKDAKLYGDKVVTQQNEQDKQFKYLIDYGQLAHFISFQNPDEPPLDGKARIIKYYPNSHHLYLIQNAFAKQGANTIKGPLLLYNTLSRVLTSKQGRTHIMVNSQ